MGPICEVYVATYWCKWRCLNNTVSSEHVTFHASVTVNDHNCWIFGLWIWVALSCQGCIFSLIFFQWEHNDTWEDFPHTADQWPYFPRKWCASIYLCQWTQGFWCPFSCLIENWFCEMASFFIFFKDIDYNRKWMVCRHMTCNFWLQRTVLPTSGQQQVINSTAFEPRITYSKHFSKFFINTYSRKQRVLQTYFQ